MDNIYSEKNDDQVVLDVREVLDDDAELDGNQAISHAESNADSNENMEAFNSSESMDSNVEITSFQASEEMDNERSGEDFLLEQIDAFREKAMQLQNLIQAKQDKVRVLEDTVSEREDEIVSLQATLAAEQEKAGSLVSDVNIQVDRMLVSLQESMDQLQDKINLQVENNSKAAEKQNEDFKSALDDMTGSMDHLKTEIADNVHNENVKVYRNIQDLMKEMDHSEEDKAASKARFDALKSGNTANLVFMLINLLMTSCLGAIILNFMGIL